MVTNTRVSGKKSVFGIALWFCLLLPMASMAQFSDDFTDGDITNNPTWLGDDTVFEATTNQLHLNAFPATAERYLSTTSAAIDNATWEFMVQLDFNPSSSNLARVYLVADQANMQGNISGYFVKIGNTTDQVSLYRQDGGSETEIIDGVEDILDVSDPMVRVRVTRDDLGNWELEADTSVAGGNFVSQGTVFDDTYTQSTYFGINCTFTSTRSDKFFFDDFNVTGSAFVDTDPPVLSGVSVASQTTLDVFFNEPLDQTTAETTNNYTADNGIGNPTLAVLDGSNPARVTLTFANAFGNGVLNTLTVNNVEDLAGNALSNGTETFMYFVPDSAEYRDVVINELMPDPSPAQGLPEDEYIELYNAGTGIYDLTGWTLSDGSSTATINGLVLTPGQHIIIVANGDTAIFQNNVTSAVHGVSSFPSLNNAADEITLSNASGIVVDQVSYTIDWYQNENKESGGWSLEQINPDLPCTNAFNWIASENVNGGTPAAQNSVFDNSPDVTSPQLLDVLVIDADTIELVLSESADSTSLANASYSIAPTVTVQSVLPLGPTFDRVRLVMGSSLQPGVVHTLTVQAISDCSGNTIPVTSETFALPQFPEPGDLIINEVLFDPASGGSDFVEIYNNSDKILSMAGWMMANFDDDTVDNFKVITEEPKLLFPQEYLVVTEDISYVRTTWLASAPVDRFIEMDLPTYSNDSSTVYLIQPDSVISDRFSYDEDIHYALLNDVEEVSLERIDFDRLSNDRTNWHSAAENVEFATPGYENSQFLAAGTSNGAVSVENEVFSPDNDGFQDVVNINYTFDAPGYVANVTIYDAKGRLVRQLTQNELLGLSGTISWDGINDAREKARVGIYVIFFEVFDLNGNVTPYKLTCVLATRF